MSNSHHRRQLSTSSLPNNVRKLQHSLTRSAVFDEEAVNRMPGVREVSSRVDYNEIFNSSRASRGSSIPFLDLPPLKEKSEEQSCVIDYAEVFGSSVEIGLSYHQPFPISENGRVPEESVPPDHHHSVEEFNTSYHKPRHENRNGATVTTEIGFTEEEEEEDDANSATEFSFELRPEINTDRDEIPSPKLDAGICSDEIFERNEEPVFQFTQENTENDGVCSDNEEIDPNSEAASSTTALKNAIKEARTKLRALKELMQRKKSGTSVTMKFQDPRKEVAEKTRCREDDGGLEMAESVSEKRGDSGANKKEAIEIISETTHLETVETAVPVFPEKRGDADEHETLEGTEPDSDRWEEPLDDEDYYGETEEFFHASESEITEKKGGEVDADDTETEEFFQALDTEEEEEAIITEENAKQLEEEEDVKENVEGTLKDFTDLNRGEDGGEQKKANDSPITESQVESADIADDDLLTVIDLACADVATGEDDVVLSDATEDDLPGTTGTGTADDMDADMSRMDDVSIRDDDDGVSDAAEDDEGDGVSEVSGTSDPSADDSPDTADVADDDTDVDTSRMAAAVDAEMSRMADVAGDGDEGVCEVAVTSDPSEDDSLDTADAADDDMSRMAVTTDADMSRVVDVAGNGDEGVCEVAGASEPSEADDDMDADMSRMADVPGDEDDGVCEVAGIPDPSEDDSPDTADVADDDMDADMSRMAAVAGDEDDGTPEVAGTSSDPSSDSTEDGPPDADDADVAEDVDMSRMADEDGDVSRVAATSDPSSDDSPDAADADVAGDEVAGTSDANVAEERRRSEERMMWKKQTDRDREAVCRAIREVRERAFNKTREIAKRERMERDSASVKLSEVEEARIRAERVAVERATVEARDRALHKATIARQQTPPSTNSSSSSANHKAFKPEPELRSRARLERHQRIAERIAKVLEEKELRDRVASREEAERKRISEDLDADVRRWSFGKHGDLRALLSTLHYILGPESRWKVTPMTEMVTSRAVKTAYKRATLCVHPDKLQQRGASIEHKYVCEKVFDLLKEAWNKFNSER